MNNGGKTYKNEKLVMMGHPMQQKPWTLLHSHPEWKQYLTGFNAGSRHSNPHLPENPKAFPCLVETLLVDGGYNHRFVYLEDAYRLLFCNGGLSRLGLY